MLVCFSLRDRGGGEGVAFEPSGFESNKTETETETEPGLPACQRAALTARPNPHPP
jgi:hypothetical protein